MANISKIKLPNGTTYTLKDDGALQLTGGTVSGPVSFNDSISIDDATIGNLVVNGSASFTNNIQANTINGVAVGNSPKFTDTNTVTTATTSGSGNAVTAITASNGALTVTKGTTFLTAHQSVSNKDATLSWGTAVTVATIGSTDIKVSLPSNPDTHHTAYIRAGASGGTANAATTTGNTYLNLVENGANRSGVKLVPGSNMAITSDASGNVTFTATNTTYSSKTAASGGTDVSLVTTDEKYTWNNKQDALVSGTNIKTINGNSILGSGDLTISVNTNFSGTTFYSGNKDVAEHNANNAVKNGNYYYTSNGPATSLGATATNGALYVQSYSDVWVGQIAQDYNNGHLYVRGKNGSSWQAWKTVPTATFSTTDLTAGSSTLATGQIYLVYE